MTAAAFCGNLNIIKYLNGKKDKFKITKLGFDLAAKNGHLDVLKYLHENGIGEGCTEIAIDWASAEGHLETVKFLTENRQEGCSSYAMDMAAANGHLNVVKYLHKSRSEGCTTKAMDRAGQHGYFEIVKFLSENRKEGCTFRCMDRASKNGHLDVVRYLNENRSEKCSKNAMNAAAARNHLPVLKYLRENKVEGLLARSIDTGIQQKLIDPDVFNSKREEGCTSIAYDYSAGNGGLDCFKYLMENPPKTEGLTTLSLAKAMANNHVEVLKVLINTNGLVIPAQPFHLCCTLGHTEIIKYLNQECQKRRMVASEPNTHVHPNARRKRHPPLVDPKIQNQLTMLARGLSDDDFQHKFSIFETKFQSLLLETMNQNKEALLLFQEIKERVLLSNPILRQLQLNALEKLFFFDSHYRQFHSNNNKRSLSGKNNTNSSSTSSNSDTETLPPVAPQPVIHDPELIYETATLAGGHEASISESATLIDPEASTSELAPLTRETEASTSEPVPLTSEPAPLTNEPTTLTSEFSEKNDTLSGIIDSKKSTLSPEAVAATSSSSISSELLDSHPMPHFNEENNNSPSSNNNNDSNSDNLFVDDESHINDNVDHTHHPRDHNHSIHNNNQNHNHNHGNNNNHNHIHNHNHNHSHSHSPNHNLNSPEHKKQLILFKLIQIARFCNLESNEILYETLTEKFLRFNQECISSPPCQRTRLSFHQRIKSPDSHRYQSLQTKAGDTFVLPFKLQSFYHTEKQRIHQNDQRILRLMHGLAPVQVSLSNRLNFEQRVAGIDIQEIFLRKKHVTVYQNYEEKIVKVMLQRSLNLEHLQMQLRQQYSDTNEVQKIVRETSLLAKIQRDLVMHEHRAFQQRIEQEEKIKFEKIQKSQEMELQMKLMEQLRLLHNRRGQIDSELQRLQLQMHQLQQRLQQQQHQQQLTNHQQQRQQQYQQLRDGFQQTHQQQTPQQQQQQQQQLNTTLQQIQQQKTLLRHLQQLHHSMKINSSRQETLLHEHQHLLSEEEKHFEQLQLPNSQDRTLSAHQVKYLRMALRNQNVLRNMQVLQWKTERRKRKYNEKGRIHEKVPKLYV